MRTHDIDLTFPAAEVGRAPAARRELRPAGGAARRSRLARGGGFTLIELLVVIAIIAVLIAVLLPMVRVRTRVNRINTNSWLRQAYWRTLQRIDDTGTPFHYATDLPSDLLSKVQQDPNDRNHLIGWGHDIYYLAPRWPERSFTWEARPREPGLTGTRRIVFSYPPPPASAALEASAGPVAQGGGFAMLEGDVVGWEEEVPGWQEAQAEALWKSTVEALKMVAELAAWLPAEERKNVFDVMTGEDDRRAALHVLDRDGDRVITLDELYWHPDALVHEALQRIVVGPWKLGVAGEKLEEIGVREEDLDFGVPFPTYGDLCDLFNSFVDAKKSRASFCAKLQAAAAAEARAQPRVAVKQLKAAKNQVAAQSGKALEDSEADMIQILLDVFIAHLK